MKPLGLIVVALAAPTWGQAETRITDITWKLGASFPELRKGCSLGVFEGKIVSAGGMQHPWRESLTTYQYDPKADRWDRLGDLPDGRVYMDGVSAGGGLYVIGGRRAGQTLAECTRLAREAGRCRWTALAPMQVDRGWAAMDAWGSRIVVAAGNRFGKGRPAFTEATTSAAVEIFDTAHPAASWERLPDIPEQSRGWAGGAVVGDAFYLFGGLHFQIIDGKRNNRKLRETLRLDLKTRTWTHRADLPYPLSGMDAVAYAGRYVILLGGAPVWSSEQEKVFRRRPGEYSHLVLVYDSQRDEYQILPSPMPHGTNDIRATRIGETIYALGGENIDKATSNTTNYLRIGTIVTAPR